MPTYSDTLKDWSTTPGSNYPAGSDNVGTNLDETLQYIKATVRQEAATYASIASASTCDIGAQQAGRLEVTGTTAITGFGTVSAGIRRWLRFAGALTLTHSAALDCTTGASITTAAGDVCLMESQGSGNWVMLGYWRRTGEPVAVQTYRISDLSAANAAKTLANAAYEQQWGWVFSANDQMGLHLRGQSNGGGTYGHVLYLDAVTNGSPVQSLVKGVWTDAGGTTTLLSVANTNFTLRGGNILSGTGGTSYVQGTASTVSASGNGGELDIIGGTGGVSGTGGNVVIYPGGGGTPGAATLRDFASSASVRADATALTLGASTKVVWDAKHVFVDNTQGAPTITAGGGTGATIRGSDVGFEVTFGTGSPTSVTVTFANAWATAPMVIATGTQSGQVIHVSPGTSSVQILSSAAFSSGTKVAVLCLGLQ